VSLEDRNFVVQPDSSEFSKRRRQTARLLETQHNTPRGLHGLLWFYCVSLDPLVLPRKKCSVYEDVACFVVKKKAAEELLAKENVVASLESPTLSSGLFTLFSGTPLSRHSI